ncbi:hypothetical protein [Halorhabdus salina]|uniref:hypothetical protein n=1 Tax=Halorhabdus salina TaxID=2750670 RepID=UPI0015EE6A44|nr:hypothetical protein [Halorhabdus salina]
MTLRELPIVRTISESGADDRVYDGLLLVGPVVIFIVTILSTILDQSIIAELLALTYIAVFVCYVLYRGLPVSD